MTAGKSNVAMFNYPVPEVTPERLKRLISSGISQNKALRAASPELIGLTNLSELKNTIYNKRKSRHLTHLNIGNRIEKIHTKKIHTRQSVRAEILPILTPMSELKNNVPFLQKTHNKTYHFVTFFSFSPLFVHFFVFLLSKSTFFFHFSAFFKPPPPLLAQKQSPLKTANTLKHKKIQKSTSFWSNYSPFLRFLALLSAIFRQPPPFLA